MRSDVLLSKRDDVLADLPGKDAFLRFREMVMDGGGGRKAALLRLASQRGGEIVRYVEMLSKTNKNLMRQLERYEGAVKKNSRRRWTPDEDEMLVEKASYGDSDIFELAAIFGRTPGAIQTRLSYLVGIKRISKTVAGRFVGTANGADFEADISGVVYG